MYKPPFCETTGILIERCENTKLNETTVKNRDVVKLNQLRYIQPITKNKLDNVDSNGTQEAKQFRIFLDTEDDVKIGDKVKINKSTLWKKTLYNSSVKDTIKMEIKSLIDWQIDCDSYLEAIAISYN